MYYVITKGGGSENGNFRLRSVLKVITKGRGGKTSNLDYVIHGWSQSKADGDEFVEYQLYFISTVFLSFSTLKKSEKEITPKIMWLAKIQKGFLTFFFLYIASLSTLHCTNLTLYFG